MAKAQIKNLDTSSTINVMFNPREYTLEKSVQWESQKATGLDAPGLQFTSGNSMTLSMELFFDTFEDRKDVRNDTKQIEQLAMVNADSHRPPLCQFSWGKFNFKGILENVSQKYTMFLEDGTPVRATLRVKFKEYWPPEDQTRDKKRDSPDHTKQRVVKQGESLALIAAQEYDDPTEWRRIADANDIDDPIELTPGTRLVVPPIL